MKTKRILALLVALIMVFQLMPVAFAEDSGDDGRLNDETVTEPAETPAEDPAEDPTEDPVLEPVDDPIDDPFRETADTQEYTGETRTVTIGIVNTWTDQNAQVHYWANGIEAGEADTTATGETAYKSVGDAYWGGEPQLFTLYTASIPKDAQFKVHNGESWFGGDSGASDNYAFIFDYSGSNIAAYYQNADFEAKVGSVYYESFTAALTAAQAGDTITLLKDVELNTVYTMDGVAKYGAVINKSVTIDGNNHTITSGTNRTIGIMGPSSDAKIDVTIKNLTINNGQNGGGCIFTRGNLNSLNLDHVNLYMTNSGYTQPLTISGGEQSNTATVTIANCEFESHPDCKNGYAIINWVPANFTISDSTIKGWACLYAQAGSEGTTYTVNNSKLISANLNAGASNAFGAIVVQDSNVTVNVTNTDIDVSGTNNTQSVVVFNAAYEDCTGSVVNLGEGNTFRMKDDATLVTNAANDEVANGGTLVITGGTFDKAVDEQYLKEGYAATDNGDGTWTVAEMPKVAKIGDVGYPTLQAAVDAAHDDMTGDVTVTLLADVEGYTIVHQKAGLNLTIDGDNKTLAGQIIIDGDGRASGTETLTIKNVKFEGNKTNFCSGTDAFVIVPSTKTSGTPYYTNKYNYAHNITVTDCSFTGTGTDRNVVAYKATSGAGDYNIVLNNITATNLHSLAQMIGTTGATITNCTVTNVENGINISGGAGTALISNNTIVAEGYTVRLKDGSSMAVTLSGNTFSGSEGIISKATGGGKITVVDGKYAGPLPTDGSKITVQGGVFTEAPKKAICGTDNEGNQLYAIENRDADTAEAYPYTVGTGAIAMTNEVGYFTFANAAAARKGDYDVVITLLDNADAAYTLAADETLKVKLDDHTLTVNAPEHYTVVPSDPVDGVTTYTVEGKPAQVIYMYNNGTGTVALQSFNVKYGDPTPAFTGTLPTRDGYTLNESDLWTPALTDTVESEPIVIYELKWVEMHTVTFDSNGGSAVAAQQVADGSYATRPDDPTKEGHTFLNWYDGNNVFNFETKKIYEDYTLKADWQINQYTVTFMDGETVLQKTTADYGTAITAPEVPAREGWIFKGWDVTVPATIPAGDLTINAVWAEAVAKIGDVLYDTLAGAIEAVQSNETIVILKDLDCTGLTITLPDGVTGVTIKGEDPDNYVTLTDLTGMAKTNSYLTFENILFERKSVTLTMRGSNITFDHCDFTSTYGGVVVSTLKDANDIMFSYCNFSGKRFGGGTMIGNDPSVTNLTIDHCTFTMCNNGIYYGYLRGEIRITNSVFHVKTYVHHSGTGGEKGTTSYYCENNEYWGWNSMGGEVYPVTFKDCIFHYQEEGYNTVRPYQDTTYEGCTFEKGITLDVLAGLTDTYTECYIKDGDETVLLTAANYADVINLRDTADAIVPVAIVDGTIYYSSVKTPDMTEAVKASYELNDFAAGTYTFYCDPNPVLTTAEPYIGKYAAYQDETTKTWIVYKLVTGITLNKERLIFAEGDTTPQQLIATIVPAEAMSQEVIWTSSDETVATVDENGNVTLVGKGTATITATSKENADIKATCEVVTAVAKIGDTLYASLAEAVAAAVEGDTIIMIADSTEANKSINVTGKNFTLDLNGKVVTMPAGDGFTGSNATIVFMDSSDTEKDGTGTGKLVHTGKYDIADVTDVTFTVESGMYEAGKYGVFYLRGNSNLTVNGGKLSTNGTGLNGLGNSTITINGGSVYGSNTGINVQGTAKLIINGGEVSGLYGAGAFDTAEITLNDGKISATGFPISSNFHSDAGITVTIKGGQVLQTDKDQPAIYMPGIGTVNIEGGYIEGKYAVRMMHGVLNISGGTLVGLSENAVEINSECWGANDLRSDADRVNYSQTPEVRISGGYFESGEGFDNVEVNQGSKIHQTTHEECVGGIVEDFMVGGYYTTVPKLEHCGVVDGVQYYPMMSGIADYPYTVGDPVAVINDSFGYATLEAAFAAAKDGDTIKVLKDSAGNGIKVPQGKFTNGLTVDFNGHSYEIDGSLVGSAGTVSQAFQLLMNNSITFKNGTISSEKAYMLIQNYSSLTLENMTLDGSKLIGSAPYTLSNNNGTIVIDGSEIIAKDGGFAFDVCRYASYKSVNVTVKGDSEINGNIEVYASNKDAKDGFSLMLEDGTFTGAIVLDASVEDLLAANTDNVWVKKIEGVEIEIPDGYAWKLIDAQNGIYLLTKAVAKIERDGKTLYFATLNDAVAAVQNGETIIMIADVNDASGIAVASGSNFTVDFDGHTYLVAGPGAGSTGTETQAFQLLKDSTITFKNGILGYAEGNTTVKRMFQNYANLTLDNMTINAAGQVGGEAYVLSFNNGSSVLKGGTKIITTSNETVAFDVYDWPSGGYTEGTHLTIEDAEINGKIVFDNSNQNRETGSTLVITGGKVGEVTHDGTLYDGQIVITGGVFRVAPLFAYCGKDAEGNQLYPIPNTDPETKEAYPYTVGIAVAKIGDVYYTTLEAAFADAIDGDTIVVLRDSAGNGIKVPQGKFTTGLTVDFNGHSYEIDGSLVGSTGTETQAFQLLMDNNITFKNGTISSEKAYMLIQNYSSLTLENMTLDGSKLIGSAPYTLSNNNGTIVIDGSEIIAKDGGFAFDVCRYASYKSVNVTVKGDSEINGNIEVYASNKDAKDGFGLMLESGTFTGAIVLDASVEDLLTNPPEKAWVKRDKTKVEIEIPAGYTWVDLEGNFQLLVKLMTVTFDADNGTEKVTVEVPKGQKVERPSDPVKNHYNFLGWFEEGAENAFDFETAITENVELKARWQGDAVMIIYTDYFTGRILQRFDVHYGDFKEAYTFTAADRITQRDGYHYNVNDMWTPPVADTATEDIVYVLKWIKGIAVTFDPDNGDEAEVVTVDRDTAVEKPATDPVKEGYTFAGWFDGNNAYDFTALVTGSLYLKAKWTPNKMTVTFDTNGGSAIEAVEVDYDTAVTMPEAPTKDGFVFNGWTLNGDAYDFSKSVTSDITLTAQWLDAVAKIGDVMYLTLKDAVDAVQNGETIVLLKDTTTVDAENGLTYTIAMNGHTLTGITWVIDNTTLTLDGSAEGSAYNGSVYVGYATNNNGNVILDGGTYTCGAGNTVLHINGTCLNSNVTIRNAKVISPDDNGIQLNGFGEFVIENSEISGATGVYVKSGHLTITNSTITGSMSPANYTYNGNGAVATGDAIVIDSCEYPGGAPVVEIGDSNTFNGTKKQVGYYEFDANRDGETQEGRVTAKTNTLTVPDGYAWLKLADNEYLLVKAVAQVEDGYYATFEEAFAVEGVVGGEKIIKLLADGAEYEFHAGDVLKVQKANDAITFVYTADEGVIVKVSEPDENGTVTYTTAEPVAKIGSTYYTTVAEAIAAVNAGETIEVLKDVAENVTIAEGKSFTLDLGGHTLTGYVDQYDADVTVKNGTIAGTIYANGLAAGQNGKLTIEADATVKADYAIILYQASDNTGNGFTIDINGTVEGIVWVMGNIKEGSSVINVNDGATITGDDVGIALNGAAIVNVKDGATVTGTSTGIEVRAGELNVTGGTISGNGAATEVAANGSGTTTSGAGIAIAQHTTELDIKVNISGGTINGATSLNVANPQGNDEGSIAVAVTGGIFNGPVNVDESETRVEKFVSGGDFIETVKPEYVVDGKLCTTTLTEEINGTDYYYIVDAVKVTFDADEGAFPAAEGEEAATMIEVFVPAGEKVEAPEQPTRENYGFMGWFAENAEEAFDFANTAITADITLKAKWQGGVYTVTVTSSGDGTPTPGVTVAHVTGGGTFVIGEKTVVSAPVVTGYTFLGWYEVNGEKLSSEMEFEYTVRAEKNDLIAVYTIAQGATFRLTVTASRFTINDGTVQRSRFDDYYTAGSTVTLKYTGSDKFLYWVNDAKKIVSTSEEYTFTLVADTIVDAVYSENDASEEALILFVSAKNYGQVISQRYYTNEEAIVFPTAPVTMGKTFVKWDKTEEEIHALMATETRIVVYPIYESNGGEYIVTIEYWVGDTKKDLEQKDPREVSTRTTLSVDETYDGESFSYWADDEGNILGYKAGSLVMRPTADVTVRAVYGVECEPVPVVRMTDAFASMNGDKTVLNFVATRSIPEGYTLERAGVLYAGIDRVSVADAKDKLTLPFYDGEGHGYILEGPFVAADLDDAAMLYFSTKKVDRQFIVRAYIVVKDAAGEVHYIYSDNVIYASYTELNNKVFHSVDITE